MGDFVRPEPVTLPLSDGRFIVVKKKLNVGEREDMLAAMSTGAGDAHLALNRREVRVRKVLTYLLSWSLTDGDEPGHGLPVPIGPDMRDEDRVATIRNLDPDIFDEISHAITDHENRAAQKKMKVGSTASSETSPSLSALAGAMSG